MRLRYRIIAGSLTAGYCFTPLLAAIFYWLAPAYARDDMQQRLIDDPQWLVVPFLMVTAFWCLVGALAAYSIQRRIDAAIGPVRERVKEAFITRRRAEKQHEFIGQFAAAVRPVASRIVGYASEVATHAQQLASHMKRTSDALAGTGEVHALLASSDELSNEIERSNEETRASNAHLEAAVFTLNSLRQNVPSFKEQLTVLQMMSRQLSLLAINASIETTRPGHAPGVAIVASEIRTLSEQAAEATHGIQQRLASIEDFSNHSLAALDPLMNNLRQLSMAFANLGALADGQWQATERLAQKADQARALSSPEELSDVNHKLLDIVQVMTEQTALLQHAVETLNSRLRSVA